MNAAATAQVRDRYGRALQVGDELDLDPMPHGGLYVVGITPSFDPSHPPGTVLLQLQARYPVYVSGHAAHPQLLLVRTREELVAAGVLKEVPPAEAKGGELQVEQPVEGADAATETGPVPPPTPGPRIALTDREHGN